MIKLRDILNEAKQVGILYYFTNEDDLNKILETNSIFPTIENPPTNFKLSPKYNFQLYKHAHNTYAFVSMSRDKFFYKSEIHKLEKRIINIRLTIDGNKLSEKYKIIPYNWEYQEMHTQHDYIGDEKEERVLTGIHGISNIKKYIIKIDKV